VEWSEEMTNLIEEELGAGMRERVAGIAITGDLVGEALRSQRRRTMIARTASAIGVVGLAGALTGGVLATGGTGPATATHRPSTTGAESPQIRLAAVIAASQDTSYRVKNTVTVKSPHVSLVVSGAFDPATTTGYMRIPFSNGGYREERLIHGDLYTIEVDAGGRGDWQLADKKHTTLPFDVKLNVLALSADPQQMFAALTQSGAKISQTAPDKYHVVVPIPPRKGFNGSMSSGTLVGDVTVGADKRIAKVAYEATVRGSTETAVFDGAMELSGYGSPVTVERPPGTFEFLPGGKKK
jgi:hypothetical protein